MVSSSHFLSALTLMLLRGTLGVLQRQLDAHRGDTTHKLVHKDNRRHGTHSVLKTMLRCGVSKEQDKAKHRC